MLVVRQLPLPGLLLIQPEIYRDKRGFFLESFNEQSYARAQIPTGFVQDNHSRSVYGTVRGLHYQDGPGQAKLVRVSRGRIWDVAVDIRANSEAFGQWHAAELSDENGWQLYIPKGFAHGFCVLSEDADVQYKVDSYYHPNAERTVAWNDPQLAIRWPVTEPLLSDRDKRGESLDALARRLGHLGSIEQS